MKKKNLFALGVAVVVLTACQSAGSKQENTRWFAEGQAELKILAGSYQDLLRETQVLAEVLVLDEKEDTPVAVSDGTTSYGVTKTMVKVMKILKNEKEVAVGDKIYVWEDYFLTKNKQGQEYYSTIEGYRPMTVGEKYYLFLKENGEGVYESEFSITGCYQGKYAVKDLKKEDFTEIEFGEGGREAYVELLKDVKGNLEF